MKFALMSYPFARRGWEKDGKFDLAGMCRIGQALGIDNLEMVTLHGLPSQEARKIAADHGQRIISYTFFPHFHHPDPAMRARSLDELKQGLEMAQILGSPQVMVYTGGHGQMPREEALPLLIEGLQQTVELAGKAHLRVVIESLRSGPLAQSVELLEAVWAAPGLKLVFDPANVYASKEDPLAFFHACKEYIVHAHMKDGRWLANPGNPEDRQHHYVQELAGEGEVDHAACLRALKAMGYAGYLDLEYEGEKYPVEEAIRKTHGYLQGILERMG